MATNPTPRIGKAQRATKESDIQVEWNLDGTGKTDIDTGLPFFDHMLTALGAHGSFDLTVHARGDVEIDAHHTVEDTGIVMGQALAQALADPRAGRARVERLYGVGSLDGYGAVSYTHLTLPTNREV